MLLADEDFSQLLCLCCWRRQQFGPCFAITPSKCFPWLSASVKKSFRLEKTDHSTSYFKSVSFLFLFVAFWSFSLWHSLFVQVKTPFESWPQKTTPNEMSGSVECSQSLERNFTIEMRIVIKNGSSWHLRCNNMLHNWVTTAGGSLKQDSFRISDSIHAVMQRVWSFIFITCNM